MMIRRIVRLLIVLAIVAGAGYVIYTDNVALGRSNGGAPAGIVQSSGTLESRPVAVVAEIGGQIRDINVREGDLVSAGAVVAQLDTATIDAQLERAQVALASAQAQVALVKAGARPEQIAQAQASLAKAVAARDGATLALTGTLAMRATPQEIDVQIAQARGQLQAAEAAIPLAETQMRTAGVLRDQYQNAGDDQGRMQYQSANAQVAAAEAGLKAAQLQRDGAQATLDKLQQMRDNPLALIAQVHAAQARVDQAEGAVAIAQAGVDAVSAGPTAEQIAVAEAQVQQAQAALDQLKVQREKMTLRAPSAGIVTTLPVRRGENAQPGAKLMTIANIEAMQFTLYVPETQIGKVKVGQTLVMKVDGLPERTFEGKVYFIAQSAEFTPTTVQTKEERAQTVFMVKARIPNADHALKPGMQADAALRAE